MDYELRLDVTGQVFATFSMGHEAIGHWLNEEVKGNLAMLDEVELAIQQVRGSERQWQKIGHEYTLWLDGEEVIVRANQIDLEGDEMEEGMFYYDEESLSCCGAEDFLEALKGYRDFIAGR